MVASVPSQSRRRTLRPGRTGGLRVRIIDDQPAADVDLGQVFRLLAKMMVRGHRDAGDQTAIIPDARPSSALTDSRNPRPDHDTNNEAA